MSNPETKSFMNIVPALQKQKTAPAELSKPFYSSTADKSPAKCLIFDMFFSDFGINHRAGQAKSTTISYTIKPTA